MRLSLQRLFGGWSNRQTADPPTPPPAATADLRKDSVVGDLPDIQRISRGRSQRHSMASAAEGNTKRPSIPGQLVNKRVSVAMDVMMPFRQPKTVYENMLDWSMVTNIHGTYYVFEQDARYWSRLFWAFTWLCLFGFSLYMIVIAYLSWRDNPVLTTVSTTALPIEEVEFPVITICGLGAIKETVEIAYLNQIVRYLSKKGVSVEINKTTTADELLDKYGFDFIREHYPGATLSPVEMVATMTSQNPIEHIRAQIVVSGGYDECVDKPYRNLSAAQQQRNDELGGGGGICNNLLYDPVTETCYDYSARSTEHDDAYYVCWNRLGYMMYPYSDQQLLGIIKLIERGPLKVLQTGKPFWVDLTRSPDGSYTLLNGQKITNSTFRHLNMTNSNIDDSTQRCFVMYYSAQSRLFIGKQSSCRRYYPSLCYSLPQIESNCTKERNGKFEGVVNATDEEDFQRNSPLERLLNPKTRSDINKDVARKKKNYYKAFQSLDRKAAYASLFELLWYSQLPCFDVNGFFDYPFQRSLLKQCRWKGIDIPCSAIFKTVPTDRGMCCTFNMKEADDIFSRSTYQTMVSSLQESDRNNSFSYSGLPDWYLQASEPKSQQGINRGLSITLDAHTDLLGSSTVSEDFQGFIAVVSSRNSFPLTSQESIRISPGHDTVVAMSAVDVQASDLQNMDVKDRKCYFSNGEVEDKIVGTIYAYFPFP